MEKEWKSIEGFQGWYEVSNLGQVRSWHRRGDIYGGRADSPKVVQPTKARNYLKVSLYSDGKCRQTLVSLLVAKHFVSGHFQGAVCAHLDGDSHNNKATNLKWATRVENESHKLIHGTRVLGEKHPVAKLSNADVVEIKAALQDPYRGQVTDLAEKYGVKKSAISAIKHGRNRKHG